MTKGHYRRHYNALQFPARQEKTASTASPRGAWRRVRREAGGPSGPAVPPGTSPGGGCAGPVWGYGFGATGAATGALSGTGDRGGRRPPAGRGAAPASRWRRRSGSPHRPPEAGGVAYRHPPGWFPSRHCPHPRRWRSRARPRFRSVSIAPLAPLRSGVAPLRGAREVGVFFACVLLVLGQDCVAPLRGAVPARGRVVACVLLVLGQDCVARPAARGGADQRSAFFCLRVACARSGIASLAPLRGAVPTRGRRCLACVLLRLVALRRSPRCAGRGRPEVGVVLPAPRSAWWHGRQAPVQRPRGAFCDSASAPEVEKRGLTVG